MAKAPVQGVFTNAELVLPNAKAAPAAEVTAPALTNQTSVTFAERAQEQAQFFGAAQELEDQTVPWQESLAAGARSGLVGTAISVLGRTGYAPEPGYTPNLMSLPGYKEQPASADEAEVLQKATSSMDLMQRWEQIQDERKGQMLMQANPVAGVAGALLGDSPLILAGFGAGAAAAAAGAGVRGVLAADTAAGLLEAGSAYYLQGESTNITGLDVIAPAMGVVAGGMWGLRQVRRANGAMDLESDSVGISTRQSMDVRGTAETATIHPVEIKPGEQWAGTMKAQDVQAFEELGKHLDPESAKLLRSMKLDDSIEVRFSADTTKTAKFDAGTGTVHMPLPVSAQGKVVNNIGDAVRLLDSGARTTLVHELFHAATVKRLETDAVFRDAATSMRMFLNTQMSSGSKFSKYLGSNAEMLAGMADPKFARALARTEVPEELASKFMQTAGHPAKASDALATAFKQQNQAMSVEPPVVMRSDSFGDSSGYVQPEAMQKSILDKLTDKLGVTKHFSLYDRIANTGASASPQAKQLADLLVADGTASTARIDSAADHVRLLQVQSAPYMQAIDDAYADAMAGMGFNRADLVANLPRTRRNREALGKRVTEFMDSNYNLERKGFAANAVPDDIKPIVEAMQKHNKFWAERITEVEPDLADALKSEWYIPRKYDYNRIRQFMQDNGISKSEVQGMFEQAYKNLAEQAKMHDYDAWAKARAERVMQGIWSSGVGSRNATWQYALNPDHDLEVFAELLDLAKREDRMTIGSDLVNPAKVAGSKINSKNVMARTQFDTQAPLLTKGGDTFTLQDLMQTDAQGLANSYSQSMAGRVALGRKGLGSPSVIEDAIEKAAVEIPAKDLRAWRAAVDNAMEQLMGMAEPTPQFMRILQNFASASMLKNSGLYQIADTATAIYERGLGNFAKAMSKEDIGKAIAELPNPKVAQEVLDLLGDAVVARDARFKWFHDQSLASAQYTKADLLEGWSQNAAQVTMKLNALHAVTAKQASINSRIIINTALQAFKGDPKAIKALVTTGGLTEGEIKQIGKLVNGEAIEDAALRTRFENAMLRMQDIYTQQNRIGEVPAWATASAAGRVLVGFMRFTLAAHNKLLRRVANRDGFYGVMKLAAIQAPFMLMVQSIRHFRDNGTNPLAEENRKELLSRTASNLSVLGIMPSISELGSPGSRIQSPAISFGLNVARDVRAAASGDAGAAYRASTYVLTPLGFVPVKAVQELSGFVDKE